MYKEGQEEAQDLSEGCGTWDKKLPVLLFVRTEMTSAKSHVPSQNKVSPKMVT